MVISLNRWVGKVGIVTGASSGIGAVIAERLVEEGLIVVGLARRSENIEEIARKLKDKKGKLYAYKADFVKEQDILNAFKWIKENVGPVSILINNAAVVLPATTINATTAELEATFGINVIGLSVATREAIKVMRENNIDGHIININSVVGHKLINPRIYAPSKHAVTALTETLRLELNALKSKIKITSISPGPTDTLQYRSNNKLPPFILKPEDVADSIVYILSTPPHVQIQELTIKAVGEVS